MILLENVHHIFGEIRHVLANYKGHVACFALLEMHHVAANVIPCPLRILHVGEDILLASEHGDWYAADAVDGDEIGLTMLADRQEGVVVGGIDLEAIFLDVLSVDHQGADRHAVWTVVKPHLVAVCVVEVRIVGRHKALQE